jgi:hypothetical protein
MNFNEIERFAASNCDMPENLIDTEKCLFLYLKCLYREYDTGILSSYYGNLEKKSFLQCYNNVVELRNMYLEYMSRWQKCEMLFAKIEKSNCAKCDMCEICKKAIHILDGRENCSGLPVSSIIKCINKDNKNTGTDS